MSEEIFKLFCGGLRMDNGSVETGFAHSLKDADDLLVASIYLLRKSDAQGRIGLDAYTIEERGTEYRHQFVMFSSTKTVVNSRQLRPENCQDILNLFLKTDLLLQEHGVRILSNEGSVPSNCRLVAS